MDRNTQAVAAAALVQSEHRAEPVAGTVARVLPTSVRCTQAAAAVVDYLMPMETVREDLAVVAMAVAEREPMALAAAAVDRLQIFQARQVHQVQEMAVQAS